MTDLQPPSPAIEPITLVLELEAGVEPICGRLRRDASGEGRPFRGLMELIHLIDSERGALG